MITQIIKIFNVSETEVNRLGKLLAIDINKNLSKLDFFKLAIGLSWIKLNLDLLAIIPVLKFLSPKLDQICNPDCDDLSKEVQVITVIDNKWVVVSKYNKCFDLTTLEEVKEIDGLAIITLGILLNSFDVIYETMKGEPSG